MKRSMKDKGLTSQPQQQQQQQQRGAVKVDTKLSASFSTLATVAFGTDTAAAVTVSPMLSQSFPTEFGSKKKRSFRRFQQWRMSRASKAALINSESDDESDPHVKEGSSSSSSSELDYRKNRNEDSKPEKVADAKLTKSLERIGFMCGSDDESDQHVKEGGSSELDYRKNRNEDSKPEKVDDAKLSKSLERIGFMCGSDDESDPHVKKGSSSRSSSSHLDYRKNRNGDSKHQKEADAKLSKSLERIGFM